MLSETSSRRKQPKQLFSLPNTAATFMVEIKGGDECPTYGRQTDKRVALPGQVFFPTVDPWVKQARFLAGRWIDSAHTIRLLQVATGTSPGKIIQFVSAIQGNRHDMFKMKRGTLQGLMHAAVFTAETGPSRHDPLKFGLGQAHAPVRPSTRKACTRSKETVSLS